MDEWSPKARQVAEQQFVQVQGKLRMAFAKGVGEAYSLVGLMPEHVALLKEAWGEDFHFDDQRVRLNT